MSNHSTKLPKQWRDWVRSMRLRPHASKGSNSRRASSWFYLEGRGHYWRVNCYGQLQCGDTYERFDRWALCSGITETPMPRTKADFSRAVRLLLAAKES